MTMSQQNVELARRAVEHLMATGEPPWDALDEEIEIHDHDILDAREYRGHAGWARWFEDWGAAWAEWSIEPEEYIDAGDWIVVPIRMKTKGRDSGIEAQRQDAIVYQLRDGQVRRIDYYNDRKQALKAVGLEG